MQCLPCWSSVLLWSGSLLLSSFLCLLCGIEIFTLCLFHHYMLGVEYIICFLFYGGPRKEFVLSLRGDFGLRLLNNVETVVTLGILEME